MSTKGTAIPFPIPNPPKDAQYKFMYSKPTYINLIGSFALQTASRDLEGTAVVDLALTMPEEIFQEKDYLNYRYFYKRSYYLAVLAAAFREAKDLKGIELSYDFSGDHLRPVLVIGSSEKNPNVDILAAKCSIRVLLSVAPETFALRKLLPSKNCVRQAGLTGSDEKNNTPTPTYNASLITDTTHFSYLAQLHAVSKKSAAFKDACCMGRMWLRQRGYGSAPARGGFGPFEWAVVMALLLEDGEIRGSTVLTYGYSNYQLFKAMLQFIANRDLIADPMWIEHTADKPSSLIETPMFFDGKKVLNVLFKMSIWSYKVLRHDARMTLEALNNISFDQFDDVFMQQMNTPAIRFDAVIEIPIPEEIIPSKEMPGAVDLAELTRLYSRKVYNVLSQALNDRATLIHIAQPGIGFSGTGRDFKLQQKPGSLVVGLLLEHSHFNRLLDLGPPPDQKKRATAFRNFWGTKAELRRFPDGSVLECAVWKENKRPVLEQVVKYAVDKHLGPHIAEKLLFTTREFSLQLSKYFSVKGIAEFQLALDAFAELQKDLQNLSDLPLVIRRIVPTGASLRYTSVDVPLSSSGLMNPADVIVQFESSNRWPDDLIAIQKTKIAFLLNISSLLEKAKKGNVRTAIGLEHQDSAIENAAYLDITYPSCACFRVRIYHDREASLLDLRRKDPNLSLREREEAELALLHYSQDFLYRPRHTQNMQKLSTRYTAFSPTARLFKKWINAHFLSSHITEEALELIVARCFLYPAPWGIPATVASGFLRVLVFLVQWDWRIDPIMLNFSGKELKADSFDDARSTFRALRKSDPFMQRAVMAIFTDQDPTGVMWTSHGKPLKVAAARITALAEVCYSFVRSTEGVVNAATLFTPSTKEYDFLLHVNPKHTRISIQGKHEKNLRFKNLQKPGFDASVLAKIDLHPVAMFLREVEEKFGDSVLLFANQSATAVGGLWTESARRQRRWKVNFGSSSVPEGKAGEVDVLGKANKNGMLNEIARLGGDIVEKVEANN